MERCADRHETRVAARGRTVEGADRSSGRLHLRSRAAHRAGRLENDAQCLSRASQSAGERPVRLMSIRGCHRLRSLPVPCPLHTALSMA